MYVAQNIKYTIQNETQLSLVQFTWNRFGFVWFGGAWFGLVWFGLVWFGLAWVETEEMQEIHQASSPESGVMAADGWGQTSIISHLPFSLPNFSSAAFP